MSTTRETEYGYFIRKKYRKGKKRRQKTTRIKPTHKKVVLDKIGDLEFYVYPFDYPDKVFVGIYPMSTVISEDDYKRFFGILNKIRWYFSEGWTIKPKTEKGAKFLRRRLLKSYELGLSKEKEAKNH